MTRTIGIFEYERNEIESKLLIVTWWRGKAIVEEESQYVDADFSESLMQRAMSYSITVPLLRVGEK